MRTYLRNLYGADPQPLRAYLTWQEAQQLTVASPAGRAVFSDMSLSGFNGKHRVAVEESIRLGLDPASWDFWHKARLSFLELGGCYAEGQAPPQHYAGRIVTTPHG